MNGATSGLIGFGFWLALALVVIALIWAAVRKQEMRHELTLKLLEKGTAVDPELLAKLLAANDSRPIRQKSAAEERLAGGGFVFFLFAISGLILMVVGIVRSSEPSWLLIGLGALSFLFGNLAIRGAYKEYRREKAEEALSRD